MSGGGVASPNDPLEMVQFTPEEVQAITRSAHSLGKYVTAHAYSADAIRQAVNNGVTCIEHANLIDEPTAKLLAEKDVFVVPTLVTYHAILRPEMSQFLPESGRQKCQQVIDRALGSIKLLQDAGVTLCYGTDLLASMQVLQHQEFEIRKQVQSDLEVLRSATVNAAKLVRMEGKIGTVKVGAFADLLVLEENPLEDVTCLNRMDRNLCAIIKEGRTVSSRLEGLKVDGMYA